MAGTQNVRPMKGQGPRKSQIAVLDANPAILDYVHRDSCETLRCERIYRGPRVLPEPERFSQTRSASGGLQHYRR